MKCPQCADPDLVVIDSRSEGDTIRRRRSCKSCGFRFKTYERVENYTPQIVKKDGRREPFERNKLIAGLQRACEKRPVSAEKIEQIVDRLESRVASVLKKEIPSREIGDWVMEELADLDVIAYVRFASVYREFSAIHQFVEILDRIRTESSL